MKDHPIICTGESVRGIQTGHKSQTRRVIKPQPENVYCNPDRPDWGWHTHQKGDTQLFCPYGNVGDRLWVREMWLLYSHMGQYVGKIPKQAPKDLSIGYKADGFDKENLFTWRSPMWMPKWAARIWLEITGVRVERVQEITQSDCISEGICPHLPCYFQKLWDSLNAKRGFGWDKNPWVRVIEFKKIEVPNVNG